MGDTEPTDYTVFSHENLKCLERLKSVGPLPLRAHDNNLEDEEVDYMIFAGKRKKAV